MAYMCFVLLKNNDTIFILEHKRVVRQGLSAMLYTILFMMLRVIVNTNGHGVTLQKKNNVWKYCSAIPIQPPDMKLQLQ